MLLASLTYVSFALGTLYISSIAGGGISAKPHVFPKCGAWCCLAVALLPHPALGFMQSPKLVPGQNCRGPRSSTVRGLHLCVPFWWLCVPLWLGIYAAWTGKQLLVYVSPHQWEWSIPCLPPQCHHSAAHRTGPVQSMRAAGQLEPHQPRLILVYWSLRSLLLWLHFSDCFLRGTSFLALLLCSLSLVIWETLLQSFGASCYTLHIVGLCVWAAVKCSDCLKTL